MIGQIFQLLKLERPTSESFVFFLHYRVTFWLLMAYGTLLFLQGFTDYKIQCTSPFVTPDNYSSINAHCWDSPSFINPPKYVREGGILTTPISNEVSVKSEVLYNKINMYRCAWIIPFLQALLFGVPYMMWKDNEPFFLIAVTEGFRNSNRDIEDQSVESKIRALASFLREKSGGLSFYAAQYFLWEILAAINLFAQIYLLVFFLFGEFVSLRMILDLEFSSDLDSLRLIFPNYTVCHLEIDSRPKSVDAAFAECELPYSYVNGFLVICFLIWFTVLLLITLCHLIFILFCIPHSNLRMIPEIISNLIARKRVNKSYEKLAKHSFGDWFVLSSLKRIIDARSFRRLTNEILPELHQI